jgi:hypothetical protein
MTGHSTKTNTSTSPVDTIVLEKAPRRQAAQFTVDIALLISLGTRMPLCSATETTSTTPPQSGRLMLVTEADTARAIALESVQAKLSHLR